jgi:hypothetical protein
MEGVWSKFSHTDAGGSETPTEFVKEAMLNVKAIGRKTNFMEE